MSEPDDAYLGPDEHLMDMIHKALQAPPAGESLDDQMKRRDRLVAVRHFEDLAELDQAWLLESIAAVEAGASATWQDPESWGGDWRSEDAEQGDDDTERIDSTQSESKALDDDEGWVGV